MQNLRSAIVAVLATLTPLAASIATAQDMTQDPAREQRMNDALQDYRMHPSGEGPAARAEDSMKRGMHKTGQAIKHGAEATEHAVKKGAHKMHEEMHKAGEKMKGSGDSSQ